MAVGGAGVRHRHRLQRSRVRRRARAIRAERPAAAGVRVAVWLLRSADAAADRPGRLRAGTTRIWRRAPPPRRTSRCRPARSRTGSASASRGRARGWDCDPVVERCAPRRLARLGARADRRLRAGAPRLPALRRRARALVRASPRGWWPRQAAASAGRDLDRFSRYAFGTFDNRLRGYPSALIRYDRGAAIRTAVAWSATPLSSPRRVRGHRVRAGCRACRAASTGSPGWARRWRRRAVRHALAAEWGYGIEGVNADGRRGTQVVRITGYKIF